MSTWDRMPGWLKGIIAAVGVLYFGWGLAVPFLWNN